MLHTQAPTTGCFLISEAKGTRSRESITLTGGAFEAGQILGKITVTGQYSGYDPLAENGCEVAAGILFSRVDASTNDRPGVAIVIDATVRASDLIGLDDKAVSDLEQVGFAIR
jgi:hypothetical protein